MSEKHKQWAVRAMDLSKKIRECDDQLRVYERQLLKLILEMEDDRDPLFQNDQVREYSDPVMYKKN